MEEVGGKKSSVGEGRPRFKLFVCDGGDEEDEGA